MLGLRDLVAELRSLVEDHPHDRCEVGKHWHDDLHKCVKISDELAMMRARARKGSEDAHDHSSEIKKSLETWTNADLHKTASEKHQTQAQAHGTLAKDLKQAGFGELARHHEQVATKHGRKAEAHRNLSKGCQ